MNIYESTLIEMLTVREADDRRGRDSFAKKGDDSKSSVDAFLR